ncbi:hypothetical protein ABEX47_22195 [Paenibacillus ehimensis]|uniref:hypothetical protein n=1 Tax=Paenibacillus ehimensis TaxID=79264 RepID=UPI000FD704F1|nr:hypothetical protein [Paenibacillus ehimensis]
MRKQWLEEYERLVVAADDLHHRIDSCGRLIDKLLVDVYRGEHSTNEAYILIQAAEKIQADLMQRYCRLRLQKAILARLIDGLHPFH